MQNKICVKNGSQPKVSIVIPCYNKIDFIGRMFNSIIMQKWDNIEIILVNDGSTDGTREAIAEYEPQFSDRGYEVVIIDQENQGVAAATRNGLIAVTGEYVCQVDADDELDPEYVSTMAGWLDGHEDCDWVCCDYDYVNSEAAIHIKLFPNGIEQAYFPEKWLLARIPWTAWTYMIRTSYLKHCNVVETFCTNKEVTQEVQIFLPLACGKGKIKYFSKPLYRFTQNDTDKHYSYRAIKESEYFRALCGLREETIERLSIGQAEKQSLILSAKIGLLKALWQNFGVKQPNGEEAEALKSEIAEAVNEWFAPRFTVTPEKMRSPMTLLEAVADNILGIRSKKLALDRGRIIAWGAMGNNGRELLPLLRETPLSPTELWDISGDGIDVKKPAAESLREDDIVLVLPARYDAYGQIIAAVEKTNCKNTMLCDDICAYLAEREYPAFYDGSVNLMKE